MEDFDKDMKAYLLKYGVTLLDLNNYVDASGRGIWNQTLNPLSNQEIVGLGNQQAFGFYQTATSSALNQFMTFKLAAASPSIKSNDFIFIGATESDALTFEKAASGTNLLNKQWLVQKNNGQAYKTSLSFDIRLLTNFDAKEMYTLLIDRANGQFNEAAAEHIEGKVVGNQLVFENLQWDVDGNGYDSFTIAKGATQKASLKVELVDRWYINDQRSIEVIPVLISNPTNDKLTARWYKEGKLVGNDWNLNATKEGNYQLVVTNQQNESFTYNTQVLSAGQAAVANTDWAIYPNPIAVNEAFSVDFAFKEAKNVEVYIYQQNGKFISRQSLGAITQHNVQTQLNAAGVYFVVAVINGKSEIKKIAVK